ncbi:MAG: hypothetical protein KJ754_07715, partial [Bacteroidetes bacterium]|nr:hypothetical protein [Bacteroidota bacterium]
MKSSSPAREQKSFLYQGLEEILNPKDALYQLSEKMPWKEKEKYDRQISAWQEMKDELKQEIVSYDVRLKSPWIYHPGANPNTKNSPQIVNAVFEKEIIAKDKINSAMLHLMADSFAELYVNDKLVGDVRGRRTLSLLVESQRAKFFDIKN